ncbi:CRISPR system precrRNA processing endoribonuclease RAMP protein Cas6 [Candidatus Poribacteria bacterium]|nr:CRISPR system precrRNA processing endoribonuclease RAMP protein Cas6 [Candidatus Poribacteria bacterium]
MLASLAIVLQPLKPINPIPEGIGHAIRGWFYEVLNQVAPEVAQELHDTQGIKPFTLSLLLGPGRRRNGVLHLSPRPYTLRLTALTAEMYQAIQRTLFEQMATEAVVRVATAQFRIIQLKFGGIEEPYASQSSYAELWQRPPRRMYAFRFISPTSFRTGQFYQPLPIPSSVYRSLWLKWNAFAPQEMAIGDELLATVGANVFPATHHIRTCSIEGSEYKFLGFVGSCRFEALGKVAEADLRALTALSEFAFYAGVGSKTTEGMGQTLVENANLEKVRNLFKVSEN